MRNSKATVYWVVVSAIVGLCTDVRAQDTLPVGACSTTRYSVNGANVEECVVESSDPDSCTIYTFNWDSLTNAAQKKVNNLRCTKLKDPDFGTKESHDPNINNYEACYQICLEDATCNAVYIPAPNLYHPDTCGMYQCVGPYTDYTGTEITIRSSSHAGSRVFWFRNKPQCLSDKNARQNTPAPTSAPTSPPTYLSGKETGTIASFFEPALNEMSLGTYNLINILSLGSLIECASACIGSSVASCKAFTYDTNTLRCALHSGYDSSQLVSASGIVVYRLSETNPGPTTDPGNSSSGEGTSSGTVIGISIGVLVAVLGAVALIWYVVSRRKYNGSNSTSTTTTTVMSATPTAQRETPAEQFNANMGVI